MYYIPLLCRHIISIDITFFEGTSFFDDPTQSASFKELLLLPILIESFSTVDSPIGDSHLDKELFKLVQQLLRC